MASVEEPVLESAPLARRMAPDLCRRDPATGEDCAWYHGFWQYLRALRLITTPEHHAEFFRDAFGVAARLAARPRILVSGAADYSTLAHVLWACRQHGAAPAVTVADACETPLLLNRWYAERAGCVIETTRADLLDYESPEAFDVVCTHSFFGRFLPPERQRLIVRWSGLLKPGGLAIAVNRVRAGVDQDRIGFSPEQAQGFRDAVLNTAASMREELGVEPEELARQAGVYAIRHRIHPVRSEAEIRQLFERAGLEVEHFSMRAGAKALHRELGGPTTLEGARYACIIARKPKSP